MTEVFSRNCERCGTPLPPDELVCPNCGGLAHRAELERLSAEAVSLESTDLQGAMLRWQRCLQLLPSDSQPYAAVYERISMLASGRSPAGPGVIREDSTSSAILKTGGSMVLSIVFYAMVPHGLSFESLLFATGFVILILVHELGHVAAMRYYGLSASPPIFIPFLGALINLRQSPQNAKVEAVVGIGGPIAGTFGALVCYALYRFMPPEYGIAKDLTHVLSYFGFLLNLFNLIPLPPLDGGRITAAMSPKIWVLGIGAIIAMGINDWMNGQTPVLLILVLFIAYPRLKSMLARRNTADPYYAIGRAASVTIAALYIALVLLLIGMKYLTRDALGQMS